MDDYVQQIKTAKHNIGKAFEKKLEREGLGDLDYDDGAGGIMVGNRGSGKVLDASRAFGRETSMATLERRQAMLADRRTMSLDEERVYKLYAVGMSTRRIAARLSIGRMKVFRIVKGFEVAERPGTTIAELVRACDPTTFVLFFALLERALTAPDDVKALIERARSVPEVRQLLEPDEVCDG